jgi:hypothetical protein
VLCDDRSHGTAITLTAMRSITNTTTPGAARYFFGV